MLRNILLVLLLIYAVNAAYLEIREVDSAEDQDEEIYADGMPKQQSLNECLICKLITAAVKKILSPEPRVDEIKAKLHKACNVFKKKKDQCNTFVEKYMDKLVKELMTDDAPRAICTKILFC